MHPHTPWEMGCCAGAMPGAAAVVSVMAPIIACFLLASQQCMMPAHHLPGSSGSAGSTGMLLGLLSRERPPKSGGQDAAAPGLLGALVRLENSISVTGRVNAVVFQLGDSPGAAFPAEIPHGALNIPGFICQRAGGHQLMRLRWKCCTKEPEGGGEGAWGRAKWGGRRRSGIPRTNLPCPGKRPPLPPRLSSAARSIGQAAASCLQPCQRRVPRVCSRAGSPPRNGRVLGARFPSPGR